MKRGIFFIAIVTLSILLIILPKVVYAEDNFNTKISTDFFEVSFDNSTYQFYHPLEHGIDRIIKIKNLKNDPINIELSSIAEVNGKQQEIISFPQPFPKHLNPNEEKEIFLKLEFSNDMYSQWVKGNTYEIPFIIGIYPRDHKELKNEITLKNEVVVIEKENNANDLTKNSQIKGVVINDLTNQPIQDAKVKIWSDWPYVDYETSTDSNGNFEAGVYAYKRRVSQQYLEYSMTIEKNGYEIYNFAYSPKENDIKEITAKLKNKEERGDYKLINQYDTGLPTYKVAISNNGEYLVTVPFHSGEKMDVIKDKAYLHLFSSDGKLICRYKLENENPTVDISDDGTLIATIHRQLQENMGGGEGIIVLNNKCDEVWTQDGLGSEIWIQDGVAISTLGPSEVKISHNKEYLAVGTSDGRIYLYNIPNKKLLWNYSTNFGQSRYILFNEDDSGVFFSADPMLFHYNINGNLDWKDNVGAWIYSMDLSKNYVITGVKAGRFITLINKTNGDIIWRYPVESRPDNLLISPDESYIVCQDSNGLISIKNAFFDISGNLLFNLKGANSGRITNDSNYLVYQSGESVELVNKHGDRLWSYQLGKEKWPAPNGFSYISNDKTKIIVADPMDGNVYFFKGGIEKDNRNNPQNLQNNPNQENLQNVENRSFWQKIKDWFLNLF